ncbi:MAG TPA: hypothetical protein VK921_03695 [Anditalea sp.]|nr:hypothetical protein [Anditalea sp.]
MKKIILTTLLFLNTLLLFAQETVPTTTADTELTDLFLNYWPVVLLPIFMIVIWGAYRRRNRNRDQ